MSTVIICLIFNEVNFLLHLLSVPLMATPMREATVMIGRHDCWGVNTPISDQRFCIVNYISPHF